MTKKTSVPNLLDYWTPPKTSNDDPLEMVPIGFVCSTFTFDADFFDDECITRFLSMENEKEDDGAAFLVEREEKLAGLHAGIVLVDQHYCKGGRSLRWDLVPCRIRNGILHAKITILHWSNCIRLIVGSANLTPTGYCINQEIFSVFDYFPDSLNSDLSLIDDMFYFLEDLAHSQCGSIVKGRFDKLIDEQRKSLKKWNIQQRKYSKDEIAVRTLLITPKDKNGLNRLRVIWDERSSAPPDMAYVTSPFFDEHETSYTPSSILPSILKQRGEIGVIYQLTTQPFSKMDESLVVNGPGYLQKSIRESCKVYFNGISEEGYNEDNKIVPRPLHLKTIWLQNEDMHLLMAGSSNFTSAGYGLGRRVNYEANVVYMISETRNKKACQMLMESHIDGEGLDNKLIHFHQRPNEDEPKNEMDDVLIPAFFGEVVVRKSGEAYLLEVNFCSEPELAPGGFEISYELNKQILILFNEAQWNLSGRHQMVEVEWAQSFIPDHLLVSWKDSGGYAFWPVVIDSQVTLPAVEGLRNLSLDALIYILSSSLPLHRLLQRIKKFESHTNENGNLNFIVDVHKLVDTSTFLLQRTKRVSYAMKALSARLEKPVFTKESLLWRLYGPVGVESLIKAIGREAKSGEEKVFLLTEFALELSRIQPKSTEISLNANMVRSMIKLIVEGVAVELGKEEIQDHFISEYSSKAIQHAINEF